MIVVADSHASADDFKRIDDFERPFAFMRAEHIAEGVYRLCTLMVNVYFVESASRSWALVDTGIRGYTATIRREAERLFDSPPLAILLTHGHFDHIGGLPKLASEWGVPVYAHPLELPYLTGRSSTLSIESWPIH